MLQLAQAHCFLNREKQLFFAERLGQVIICSQLAGFNRIIDTAMGRNDDNHDLAIAAADCFQDLDAGDIRHLDIGNDNIKFLLLEICQSRIAAISGSNLKSVFL